MSLPDVREGDTLTLDECEVTSHKTKAKPLFTEAGLLSAMENAGKEVEDADSRKAMVDCGIGTPATRANIIETLILREYIRREKKTIVPTDKGMSVYELVKGKRIADAEMTGAWEVSIAAIEAGAVSSEGFTDRIKEYTARICNELLEVEMPRKQYPVYKCPKCGEESVGFYAKIAKCRSEGCDFHVFREVAGSYLSEDNLRDLLSQGRTPILKGLAGKSGKKFNARIVFKEDFSTGFEFEQTGTSRKKQSR